MEKYIVTGMSCAACQARVEKAVSKLPGVDSCAVSLLTNTMGVDGSASSSEIIKAVEEAGYGAKLQGTDVEISKESGQPSVDESMLEDHETPKETNCITGIFNCFDVHLHGAYDVGISASGIYRWKPHSDGNSTDATCGNNNGNKSKVLRQWF